MVRNIYNPYYSSNYKSGKIELDLRQEMYELLFGSSGEIPKAKIGLLRIMRRDTDGNPIRCACVNELTDDPDTDRYCRYCLGWKFYWDEYPAYYYKNDEAYDSAAGISQDFISEKFYIEYNKTITPNDYIIEIKLDQDGVPVTPTQRLTYYDIMRATPMRSDRGRIEFWQVRAKHEPKWSVWYDVKLRQT